jgi:hypothetical protein
LVKTGGQCWAKQLNQKPAHGGSQNTLDQKVVQKKLPLEFHLKVISEIVGLRVCSCFFFFLKNLSLYIYFSFLLLFWVRVNCGIYKCSYNISNISCLNSLPPPFSFIASCPHSWNSFNRSHFSIYIHMYTEFVLYSPSHTLFTSSPPSHW